ncbi:MAG: hypothetical protein R3F19_18940 [Verrucomicrobiales bacterium]|nr:hypothetical protein [Verrucomicrobiae bacterium]
MKTPAPVKKCLSAGAALTVALLFSNCASTVQSRIEKNAGEYNSLSKPQQELVRRGQIEKGMPKSGVFLAWGRPDHVTRGNRDGKDFETWRYNAYQPVYTQSVAIGIGPGYGRYGRYGYGWGPDYGTSTEVYYRPYTAARVDFNNNKVSAWESVN